MAKGHRLQKRLKSEKSKVKLKNSKLLPKGTNVTDTSFKIKQIVIPQQLKATTGEVVSKRKLNLKELISRLRHYNVSVRGEALGDLRDLVTNHPNEIVFPNLSQLLHAVAQLVLDVEKTVRRDALRLISSIIAPVPLEKIAPFFETLSSYLRCAMTHIDANIQEDSLLLLDTLLASVPTLVAKNSNRILPNFFDLITKLRSDSKPGRTLSTSLGNKITDVKWRIKVLTRLHGILEVVIEEKRGVTTVLSQRQVASAAYIPLYASSYLTATGLNERTETNDVVFDYLETLVRLLFDTWLEVGPEMRTKVKHNVDSTLTDESFEVLACSLKILHQLWSYVKLDENGAEMVQRFVSKYRREFSTYFMVSFPYTQVRKRKRSDGGNFDAGCTDENLLICNVFFLFNKRVVHEHQEENVKKIGKYIVSCLLQKNLSQSNIKTLLMVLETLFIETSKSWSECNIDSSQILQAAVRFYRIQKLTNETRNKLFNILSRIVTYSHLNSTPSFQMWLSTLPELLLSPDVTKEVVDVILQLVKQNNKIVSASLSKNFQEVIRNAGNLDDALKYNIIFLYYWVPIPTDFEDAQDELTKVYLKKLLQLKN